MKKKPLKIPVLQEATKQMHKDPIVSQILSIIRKYLDLPLEDLRPRNKKRGLVFNRQIIMYFLSKHTKYSLATISNLLLRDHATAVWANKTIKNLIETEKRVESLCLKIDSEIQIILSNNKDTKYSIFMSVLDELELSDEEHKIRCDRFLKAI